MKILHLFHHSNLTNGVDRTTLTLLTALQQLGVEVRALVPARGEVTEALDASRVLHRIAPLGCCTGSCFVVVFFFFLLVVVCVFLFVLWLCVVCVVFVFLFFGFLFVGVFVVWLS